MNKPVCYGDVSCNVEDAHHPPNQLIEYLGVPLRLSGLVEMLLSHSENTFTQLLICARYYKERAMRELYPNSKSLTLEKRRRVARRAIGMAIEDSRSARSVPEEF